MSQTTGIRFLRSTIASYTSLFVRVGVAFVARVVLARLVLPEGHGQYELALRVVILASALRDLGLPFHLMRDRRRPYGTVLGFSLATGTILTVAVALLAPLFSGLDPQLPELLRVFSVWILLDALVIAPRTYFERELQIEKVAMPEIWRGLVVAGLWIGLGWFGWGVWSLIIGDLVGAAVFAALVWARAAGRMPLRFEPALIPGLLRSSQWLFLIWIVLQAVTYIDAFIVGAYGDAAAVGQYARAYMIATLVPLIVAPRALLPTLVEVADEPERFATAFRLGTVVLMAFQVPAGYFLFFNAPKVVDILLGPNWEPAVALLQILCFVPFLDVFKFGGEVLKVRHEDRTWLALSLLNLACLVGFGIAFTARWGPAGMAFANFLLLGNLVMAWRMSRIFGAHFVRLLGDLAVVYVVPLAPILLAALATPPDSWLRFWVCGAASAVALAMLGWRYFDPMRAFLRE